MIRFLGIFLDRSKAGKRRECIFYLLCLLASTYLSIVMPTDVDWILWMLLLPGAALTYKERLGRKLGVVVLEEAVRLLIRQIMGYVILVQYPVTQQQRLRCDVWSLVIFLLAELGIENIERMRRRRNVEMLKRQLAMYSSEFALIHETQNQVKGLRHDMKHHLRMLEDLIRAKDQDGALAYVEQMREFMENKEEYAASGNEMIDSILNYYLRDAKQMGAAVEKDIQIPETLPFPAFDINVILSNLLENAMAALRNTADKKLEVRIKMDRGFLVITVANTYEGVVGEERGTFITRKPDSCNHGIGLENVKRITEKYSGECRTYYNEERFQVDILLYMD